MRRSRRRHRKIERAREAARQAALRQPLLGQVVEQDEPDAQISADPAVDPHLLPLTFAEEGFRETLHEAMPLIQAHAEEVGLTAMPWPFRPAMNAIAAACESGIGVWITARASDGQLVGYALWGVSAVMPFRDLRVAACEAIYIAPEWRGRGLVSRGQRMMRFCEQRMRDRGVGLLQYISWTDTQPAELLEGLGYKRVQDVFWKPVSEGG